MKKKKRKKKKQENSRRVEEEEKDEEEGEEDDDDDEGEEKERRKPEEETPSLVDCETCGKKVPKVNLELHQLRCRPVVTREGDSKLVGPRPTSQQQQQQHQQQHQPAPKSTAKNSRRKQQKSLLDEAATDDFDELVKLADKMNNVCNLKECKTKISVLGQDCGHCCRRFCLSHHMPEIHGCGEAAKAKAKNNSIKVWGGFSSVSLAD